MAMRIVCYRDESGEWRWRMLARNGKVVADSAESYKRKGACLRMAARVADGGAAVQIEGQG